MYSKDLIDYITSRLSGTSDLDYEISGSIPPSNRFILGSLASRKFYSDDESLAKELNEDEKASSIRSSALKVSFLLPSSIFQEQKTIKIKASGNIYIKVQNPNPLSDDSSYPSISNSEFLWRRYLFEKINEISLSLEPSEYDFSILDHITDPTISYLGEPDKNIKAKISTKAKRYDSNSFLFTITYENISVEPPKDGKKETKYIDKVLFNCNLNVDLNKNKTLEFCDDYFYNEFEQRYFYDFRSVNCQADWDDPSSKNAFHTSFIGQFMQENIRPRETIEGLDLRFSNLMEQNNAIYNIEQFLKILETHSETYNSNYSSRFSQSENPYKPRSGNIQKTWEEQKNLVSHFDELVKRIESGVNLLKTNSSAMDCFLKVNETFYNNYSSANLPNKNAGWRVFQLAFLLATLESVVLQKDLDCVDVLHVDTGGGKSEAYFALIIFTIFYERLNKKQGVSAIVKFPLRMLSIQQLERVSSLVIHAEEIRRNHSSKYSGAPFSLGYYVGTQDEFPATYSKNAERVFQKDGTPTQSPILEYCPLCPPESKGKILLEDDSESKRVLHKCEKCHSIYYIYLSDHEIYAWQPTVIVSTVDKWSSLAMQRKVRNILGGTGSMCPDKHGFIPSGDVCENSKEENWPCKNIGKSADSFSGPLLSIQDEMHLLKEQFGAISSHFEGLIENTVKETSRRGLKHITMSATLNGTEKQVRELYGKECFIIPGQCPEGVGSSNDLFFEKLEGPKRIIYGLKPNIRDNHYASLRSVLHFFEFLVNSQRELNQNPPEFCKKYALLDYDEAFGLIKQFLIPLTYHLKKQDVYDMSRLESQVIVDELKQSTASYLKSIALTGDAKLDELKAAIDEVKSYVRKYNCDSLDSQSENELLVLYSNAVVSHGVDLAELNFMTFQGLPYSTSEYIQALSRVGRKHLGIVLLWFYPNRVRDDSFYRNFYRYHNSLDHEVRPVPINRFAKLGMLQTMNSLFCASIINVLSNSKSKSLYRKEDVGNLESKDREFIIAFIKRCYGRSTIDINVEHEVEERILQIKKSDAKPSAYFPIVLRDTTNNPYYNNQTGMRGIQKSLILLPEPGTEKLIEGKHE